MNKILTSIGIFAQTVLSATSMMAQEKQMNVLFIAVDDLKPILGCYGNNLIKTPNIDRLASRGTVFMSNYCQQAVSGPTRASLLTGMRPDHTGVWDLKTRMRDVNPDILSLPQYFISQGYSTQGIGKVYDVRCVDEDIDKPSWSIPYYKNANDYFSQATGEPALNYQLPETKLLVEKYQKEAKEKGIASKDVRDYVSQFIKPSVECADVPDNAYGDGANALKAKDILIDLAGKKKPFFFAVGFAKPHLPFISPKKYWDLYKRDEMPVAEFQEEPRNGIDIAFHNAGELRAYTDIPPLLSFTDQKDYGLTLPLDKQKELIHGYYAAVSYTDAQIGLLLNTIDSLGLSNNTIIVLWGDHGWHLGDHNLWCKHTNFEQATNAPLIISTPFINASVTKSPSEFIDIFPTLCELIGMSIPKQLDGKSLVPMMKNPSVKVKEFAVSQYPRSGNYVELNRLGYADGKFMGYSIRTERYRYTVWMKDNFRSTQAFSKDLMVANELYDYVRDPNETVNVIDEKTYKSVSRKMHKKMLAFLKTQANS
jgi:arylsulfatase A-like enzyme